MLRLRSLLRGSSVSLALSLGLAAEARCQTPVGDVVQGRELFEHEWLKGDPLCPDGDGLGPVFNARSCVACHFQGSVGGAGAGADKGTVDVIRLTKEPLREPKKASEEIETPPDFAADWGRLATDNRRIRGGTLLHLFSLDAGYRDWRIKLLMGNPILTAPDVRLLAADHGVPSPSFQPQPLVHGAEFVTAKRDAPALFGAGLIDRISERKLLEIAGRQRATRPKLAGRVAVTSGGRVGRFGWRGQTASLREFVLSACAMELGLQNDRRPQPTSLRPAPTDPERPKDFRDLSPQQCDSLAAFCSSLPQPVQVTAAERSHESTLKQGERLFQSIGCASCHVRDIDDVKGIYSDLLLHDMGSSLADPFPARTGQFSGKPDLPRSDFSEGEPYYGGSAVVDLVSFQIDPKPEFCEWRTPPLWGLRDSAPYLHDGRAPSIDDAILAHGGQAKEARKRYEELGIKAQASVLIFLSSLAAP